MDCVRCVCIRIRRGRWQERSDQQRRLPDAVPGRGYRVGPSPIRPVARSPEPCPPDASALLRNVNQLGSFDLPIDSGILDEFRAALELSLRHLLGDDAISGHRDLVERHQV